MEKIIITITIIIVFLGATVPSGLGAGHCGGFKITLRQIYKLGRTRLDD